MADGVRTCAKCGSEMVSMGRKWVCSNENCAYLEFDGEMPWHQQLARDDSMWNRHIMEEAPFIIAYEYQDLYDLVKGGRLEGLGWKIKDLLETEIKFLSLIKLSQAFHNGRHKELYKEYLYDILQNPPSMGKWVDVALHLGKMDAHDLVSDLLGHLAGICEKNKIVQWRNETIGHGALPVAEAEQYHKDIRDKIKILQKHYEETEDSYKALNMIARGNNKRTDVNLKGCNAINKLNGKQKAIFVKYEGNVTELLPLIKIKNDKLYFFNAYFSKKKRVTYYDYVARIQEAEASQIFDKMFESLRVMLTIKDGDANAESKFISSSGIKSIEEILRPSSFIRLSSLEHKLHDVIVARDKGVYLLQMEEGMGKTTFVRMMDRLSYHCATPKRTMVRAVYINAVYGYKLQYLATALMDSLRLTDSKDKITGEIPFIDVTTDKAKQSVADFINDIYKYNVENENIDRMILFIDGIDEIPYATENTILDILPHSKDLASGIHVVLTGRLTNQMSTFIQKKVKEFSLIDESIVLDSSDSGYRGDLEEGICKIYGVQSALASKMRELADNKIMNINYVIRAYAQSDNIRTDGVKGELEYWEFLKDTYGDQYFQELMKVAIILAQIPLPIAIGDLALLMGDNYITFKLQAFVGELKQFIHSERMADDTVFIITRPETRDHLRKQTKTFKLLCTQWKQTMESDFNDGMESLSDEDFHYLGLLLLLTIPQADLKLDKNKLDKCLEIYETFIARKIEKLTVWEYHLNEMLIKTIVDTLEQRKNDVDLHRLGFFINRSLILFKRQGLSSEGIALAEKYLDFMRRNKLPLFAFVQSQLFVTLGSLHAYINNKERAEKYFEQAKFMEDRIEVPSELDELSNGKDYAAVQKFKALLAKHKELQNLEILLAKAVKEKNDNKPDKAIKLLEQARTIIENKRSKDSQGYAVYSFNMYQIWGNIYKRRNPEKALECFAKAMEFGEICKPGKTSEAWIDLLMNIGQTYRQLGRYDDADKIYHRALSSMDEAKEKGEHFFFVQAVNVYKSMGNVQRDQKHYEDALNYYTKAIDLIEREEKKGHKTPSELYMSALKGRMDMYIQLGNEEFYQADAKKFESLYETANWEKIGHMVEGERDGSRGWELWKKANDNIQKRNYKEAVRLLKEAIQVCPEVQFFMDMAFCCYKLNRYKEAAENTFQLLARIAPAYSQVVAGGWTYDALKKKYKGEELDKEIHCLITAQAMNAHSLLVYFSEIGEYSKAITFFLYGFWLMKNTFSPTGDIIWPEGNNRISVKGSGEIFPQVIAFIKSASEKGRRAADVEQGNQLLEMSRNILKNKGVLPHDSLLYFLELVPNGSREDIEMMKKMYSYEMVAFELINRAIEFGNQDAFDDLFNFYNDKNSFAYYPEIGQAIMKLKGK